MVNCIIYRTANQNQLSMDHTPGDTVLNLQLDPDIAAAFQSAAKWARFIAIVFFVFIAFFIVILLFAIAMSADSNVIEGVTPGLQFGLFLLFLIPFTLVVIQLYRFAIRTREAIQRQDQDLLNRGLRNLRTYLAVYGVLSMLGIAGSIFNIIRSF